MTEHFTEEEKKLLEQFMTNIDKPIFVLVNLPEVVKGALFSRYSRSAKTLRRVLLDEFILKPETGFKEIVNYQVDTGANQAVAIKKAEEFYDRVLVGYGDDSVAELAGAHVAIEDVSNIATKIIEDSRIGLSPLEKSTRYVYFDKKENGRWLYYLEPKIMQSKFSEIYEKTSNFLFETYAELIPKISKYIIELYPKEESASDRAYSSTVRAKTCDILRGLLPASTLTNMGMYGDGRAYEYLMTKMYSSKMKEITDVASTLQEELKKVIPSFVKRANDSYGIAMQNYMKNIDETTSLLISQKINAFKKEEREDKPVALIDYDINGDEKIVAAIIFQYSDLDLEQAYIIAKNISDQEKNEILSSYVGKRQNRRHKPSRAFENTCYTFDVLANFGAYRDIHRHRILTQQRQLLSCNHGYTMPKEIIDAGYENEFKEAMQMAKQTYTSIAKEMPEEAQYVVPLAYKIRWYMKLNLREAIHLCELRSMQQGHIDYRKIAQEMAKEIIRVHPSLGKHLLFVDMKSYDFERLESEKKIDKKLEEMKKKYGD